MDNGKLPLRLRSGKKVIHGGYSFMRTGELPQGPGMVEIERYLTYIRESYIGQLTNGGGETALTSGQLVLINKVTTLEGCQRLVEVDAARSGSVKTLDERYNSRNNLIVKICLALGIERGPEDPEDFLDYVDAFDKKKEDAEKKAEAAKK